MFMPVVLELVATTARYLSKSGAQPHYSRQEWSSSHLERVRGGGLAPRHTAGFPAGLRQVPGHRPEVPSEWALRTQNTAS